MSPLKTFDDLQPRIGLMEKEAKFTKGSLELRPSPIRSTGTVSYGMFHNDGNLEKQIGRTETGKPNLATINLVCKNVWTVISAGLTAQQQATVKQAKTA